MRSKSYKIKAFTLSELIIVILLTVIVAGIAFSVLTLVRKHMYAIQTNLENSTNVRLLEQSLWIDVHRSDHIQYDDTSETLHFISEIDTASYHFESTFVRKERDTFQVAIQEKQFYFKGDQTNDSKIDALKLIAEKEFRNSTIFVYKRNTANTFMSQ